MNRSSSGLERSDCHGAHIQLTIDHFSLCLDIVVVLGAPSYAQSAHCTVYKQKYMKKFVVLPASRCNKVIVLQKNTQQRYALQTMFWNKVQNNIKQNIQLNRDEIRILQPFLSKYRWGWVLYLCMYFNFFWLQCLVVWNVFPSDSFMIDILFQLKAILDPTDWSQQWIFLAVTIFCSIFMRFPPASWERM